MKKTLVTCAAVVALFAIAGSAAAVTCTVDKRPAATLLVPYFEVSLNPDGTVLKTGATFRDTLVTIVNASAAPMIAHVNVFTKRSDLVLDFNIALTAFDVQAFAMSDILSGKLPNTGRLGGLGSTGGGAGALVDACQRTGAAANSVFLRIGPTVAGNPPSPTTGLDNTRATTLYGIGNVWSQTDPFGKAVLDSLDTTDDERGCAAGIDGVITGPASGYITIDHVNYCNLSNPRDPNYYLHDAIGMENNLWGDVIFVSGAGLSTYAGSMVHIEADPSLAGNTTAGPFGVAPPTRTFYARYVPATDVVPGPNPLIPLVDQGWGDQREPLGLKYAARWFDTAGVTSNFTVWRASYGNPGLWDLLDNPTFACDLVEPNVTLTFWDEDENQNTSGTCPSPCSNPTFNFPWEDQHTNIAGFSHPAAAAGWVNMVFYNPSAPVGGIFDQAYVLYDFVGAGAFLSMQENAAQLDPSTCNPLGIGAATRVIAPVFPALVGTGSP